MSNQPMGTSIADGWLHELRPVDGREAQFGIDVTLRCEISAV